MGIFVDENIEKFLKKNKSPQMRAFVCNKNLLHIGCAYGKIFIGERSVFEPIRLLTNLKPIMAKEG